MRLVQCPFCGTDDVAMQDYEKLNTVQTVTYTFIVWVCNFFCHNCAQEFVVELDDDERKEYV